MRIGYATSPRPEGPFTDRGVLLDSGGSWGYTIDPNLIEYEPGKWIMYYGSTGGPDPRDQTGISVVGITINSNGTMRANGRGGVIRADWVGTKFGSGRR